MIKVKLAYHEDALTYVKISGHANSDEYGKDLVCAGVSTIIVGVYNTLEKLGMLDIGTFKVEEGLAEFIIHKITRESQLILETLVTTLETIEYSYGDFIQIKKMEE